MKTLLNILGWTIAVLLLLQLIKIDIPKPPAAAPTDKISAPSSIITLLKKSCYDCHSNQINIPWYGNIAPISFEVRGHIKDGREWLNFDIWEQYDEKKKQERLKGIVKTIDYKMPIPMYLSVHDEAKLSKNERKSIKKWAQSLIEE